MNLPITALRAAMGDYDGDDPRIDPQDVILAISKRGLVLGKPPGDIADALLSSAATMVQLASTFKEEDFVERAREIWRFYEERQRREAGEAS